MGYVLLSITQSSPTLYTPLLRYRKNFNDSNTDGSFTMADSNSFLSPEEILSLAQENKYLGVL